MIELRMSDAAQRQVVRLNMRVILLVLPLALLAQIPLLMVPGMRVYSLCLLGLVVALLALAYPWTLHVVRSARVVLGDGTYTVRWMTTRRFTVADAARVVTIDQLSLGDPRLTTHHLVVAGRSRRLVHLVGQVWDRDQLSTLALDLAHRGVPLTPIHTPLTPVQLRAYDPRLMPWWQAHRIAFALLVAAGAGILGIVVVVVVLAIALG